MLRFVDVELGAAHALGVELPIPRLEREATALGIDHRLNARGLGVRALDGGLGDVGEQTDRRRRRLRHLIVEREVRRRREAEQPRRARRESSARRRTISRVSNSRAVVGAMERRLEHALAHVAAVERLEHRLLRRVLQT